MATGVERSSVSVNPRAGIGATAVQRSEAASVRRASATAAWGIVLIEIFGAFLMWLPNPLAWIWVGARAFEATDRMIVGGSVALFGIIFSTVLLLKGLAWLDARWIDLRRRAGHDQKDGALTWVVVVSATMGIVGFYIWNLLSKAFIMPFMPMN